MTFDPVATTELMDAARFGDVARMRAAIAAGADPDVRCPASGSLVCLAAMYDDKGDEMLALLLGAGANPNAVGKFDRCALTIALTHPYIERAEMLIKSGADINFQPQEGKSTTILFAAIVADLMHQETLRTEFVLLHKPDLYHIVRREAESVTQEMLVTQELAHMRIAAPGWVDTIDKLEKLLARYTYENPSPQELQKRADAQARAAALKNKIKDARYKL